MKRVWVASICVGMAVALAIPASARDAVVANDAAGVQLTRVIAVLRLQPDAAGPSCLDALREVHKTEDQVKLLQGPSHSQELPLAQDVLDTEYENGYEICGADANRVCTAPRLAVQIGAACGALRSTR